MNSLNLRLILWGLRNAKLILLDEIRRNLADRKMFEMTKKCHCSANLRSATKEHSRVTTQLTLTVVKKMKHSKATKIM